MRKSKIILPVVAAALITVFILRLFYYWFVESDRLVIFLYWHYGAGPFDRITIGRYLIAGLVADALVMVIVTCLNWVVSFLASFQNQKYHPPSLFSLWFLCALPLSFGLPLIMTKLGQPPLPLSISLAALVITLLGLALALVPSSLIVKDPALIFWLILDGVGLMPVLLFIRVLELPKKGLMVNSTAWFFAILSVLASFGWLLLTTKIKQWLKKPFPKAANIFLTGLRLSYLLMPLLHYLIFTPPNNRYLSTTSNFFADNFFFQIIILGIAFEITRLVTKIRLRFKEEAKRLEAEDQ